MSFKSLFITWIFMIISFLAIFFLSLSDLLFCTIPLPLQAVRYFSEGWPFGEESWTCKLYPWLLFSNIALSLYILVLISVNRAIVLHDFRYVVQILLSVSTLKLYFLYSIQLLAACKIFTVIWLCIDLLIAVLGID